VKKMAKWYAASAVFVTRTKDAPSECAMIEERVYLIEDDGLNDVWDKASRIASEEENRALTFEYCGKAATEQFVGIRKVIGIRPHLKDKNISTDALGDGAELTFSFFHLNSSEDLQAFVDGDEVRLIYKADPVYEKR
jgi:hypothetical protein